MVQLTFDTPVVLDSSMAGLSSSVHSFCRVKKPQSYCNRKSEGDEIRRKRVIIESKTTISHSMQENSTARKSRKLRISATITREGSRPSLRPADTIYWKAVIYPFDV